MTLLFPILAVIAGFSLLVWGADRFVTGAAATARNLGVSPLIIGLTIVGFGTSAPEMLVSGVAAWQGNPGLAIGNAIGSNVTNIGLILGTTALVLWAGLWRGFQAIESLLSQKWQRPLNQNAKRGPQTGQSHQERKM